MNRILILSADLTLINRLAPAMREADFDVACAADIAEGLKQLDQSKIGLVILDELLPADSWRLCQRINHVFNINIIFMGSQPDSEAWCVAEETGFDFYMEKPVSFPELSTRAKALLRRRKATMN